MSGWRHAFAVDPPGPAEPDETQKPVVEWFCRQIVKRHMTTPALFGLEMARPLNFVGSQIMVGLQPIVSAIFDTRHYEALARFLEHRGALEYICLRVEALEAEATRVEKEKEKARKAARASEEDHDPD